MPMFAETLERNHHIDPAIGARKTQHIHASVQQCRLALDIRTQSSKKQNVVCRRAHKLRIERRAKRSVEHDPQQRVTARKPGSIGERRIIREHGSNARQDRIRRMPKLLHILTRRFPGDPVRRDRAA